MVLPPPTKGDRPLSYFFSFHFLFLHPPSPFTNRSRYTATYPLFFFFFLNRNPAWSSGVTFPDLSPFLESNEINVSSTPTKKYSTLGSLFPVQVGISTFFPPSDSTVSAGSPLGRHTLGAAPASSSPKTLGPSYSFFSIGVFCDEFVFPFFPCRVKKNSDLFRFFLTMSGNEKAFLLNHGRVPVPPGPAGPLPLRTSLLFFCYFFSNQFPLSPGNHRLFFPPAKNQLFPFLLRGGPRSCFLPFQGAFLFFLHWPSPAHVSGIVVFSLFCEHGLFFSSHPTFFEIRRVPFSPPPGRTELVSVFFFLFLVVCCSDQNDAAPPSFFFHFLSRKKTSWCFVTATRQTPPFSFFFVARRSLFFGPAFPADKLVSPPIRLEASFSFSITPVSRSTFLHRKPLFFFRFSFFPSCIPRPPFSSHGGQGCASFFLSFFLLCCWLMKPPHSFPPRQSVFSLSLRPFSSLTKLDGTFFFPSFPGTVPLVSSSIVQGTNSSFSLFSGSLPPFFFSFRGLYFILPKTLCCAGWPFFLFLFSCLIKQGGFFFPPLSSSSSLRAGLEEILPFPPSLPNEKETFFFPPLKIHCL